MEGRWYTTGGGDRFPAGLIAVILAIGAAAGVAGAVEAALSAILAWLIPVMLAVAAVAAGAGFAWLRRWNRAEAARFAAQCAVRKAERDAIARRRQAAALSQPPQQHVHFHGISPADIAGIINGRNQ